MNDYIVELRPAAARQLAAIEARIAEEATDPIARRYVAAVLETCFALDVFPDRGTPRDDIKPGLRTLVFKRNVLIAYAVEADRVAVLGIGWRDQDIARLIKDV